VRGHLSAGWWAAKVALLYAAVGEWKTGQQHDFWQGCISFINAFNIV
jgi:hypothetical protein